MEESIEKRYKLVDGFRRTDLEHMVKYLSNPAVVQNLRTIPVPYTEEEANKYYDYLEKNLQSNPPKSPSSLHHSWPRRKTDRRDFN